MDNLIRTKALEGYIVYNKEKTYVRYEIEVINPRDSVIMKNIYEQFEENLSEEARKSMNKSIDETKKIHNQYKFKEKPCKVLLDETRILNAKLHDELAQIRVLQEQKDRELEEYKKQQEMYKKQQEMYKKQQEQVIEELKEKINSFER